MTRQKMTSRKKLRPTQKYEGLDRQYSDFIAGSISIHSAWVGFIAEQITKATSKVTIDFYNRFYRKRNTFYRRVKEWGL